MTSVRNKKHKFNTDGPDLLDASGAIQILWDDYKLYFRSTVVIRDGKLLVRGYAHDECSLPESRRVYQTYKRFDLTGRPDLGKALYALAFDLYWQAATDEVNHVADSTDALELP